MSGEDTAGRPRTVTDEELLAVLASAPDPVLTTAEVAERLPIGSRATLDRLKALAESGRVARKTVGARGAVWWLDDAEDGPTRKDPFLDGPTYASGDSGVSERVDTELVDAIERDS